MQQSVALQIRGEVLKSKGAVYKVTCSNVDDMDVLISRMQPWASWTKCYSQFLTPPLSGHRSGPHLRGWRQGRGD